MLSKQSSGFKISLDQLHYFLLRVKVKSVKYCQYATKNPRWLLMFLLCRLQIVRSVVKSFSQMPSVEKYRKKTSLFETLDVNNAVSSVRRDGLYFGINLPINTVQEILKFAESGSCCANRDSKRRFKIADKNNFQAVYGQKIIVGEYLNASNLCPALKQLENDPKLLEIAATYLNSEPICSGSRLWWNFVVDASLQERLSFAQELFHYDPVDYGAIKFFFYLTDVDSASGPHVCVRGSHKKKKLSHQLTLFVGRSDQDIIDYYKSENVLTLCEKAGFGFAEDPFCFHKGTPPKHKDRLMLEIEYRLNDYRLWKTHKSPI